MTSSSLPPGDLARSNLALRQTETAFYRRAACPIAPGIAHTIYAPGEFTGYAAVVIPGVNEAMTPKTCPAPRQLAVTHHRRWTAATRVLQCCHVRRFPVMIALILRNLQIIDCESGHKMVDST